MTWQYNLDILVLKSLRYSSQARCKRGGFSPPVFGQTVNPISIRGAYYAHHSTTSHPGFSDLATALSYQVSLYWKELFKSLKNTFLLIGQNSNQDHNFQEGFKYCLHIALVYCPTSEKQILFAVVITIWMLPIYTVIVFSGYIFMQFCRTISENFKQLRHDIGEKSRQVIFFLSNLGNKILNIVWPHF